ncbi:MAG: hypothetical protein SFV19_01260 [Rhodospirillaceae bacterium]|nr:hypothetical protein [Rhodospirillaceae bacterium]
MCSRYELATKPELLIAAIALHVPLGVDVGRDEDGRDPFEFRSGEIRPTDTAPVVLPGRRLATMPWGLKVDWQS